jgi:hypothetical protein
MLRGVSALRTGTPRRTFLLPSVRYTSDMPDTHHLAKPELRKRIREMLASGMTQAAIARQLHKSVSTIAFHVRNIGIAPKEYTTPEPIVRGKRQCAECGRSVPDNSRRGLHGLSPITSQGIPQLILFGSPLISPRSISKASPVRFPDALPCLSLLFCRSCSRPGHSLLNLLHVAQIYRYDFALVGQGA